MANNNSLFFLLIKKKAGFEISRDKTISSSKKGFIASHIEEKSYLKGPSSQGFYEISEVTLKKIAYFLLTFIMSLNLDISWQLLKLYDIIPDN